MFRMIKKMLIPIKISCKIEGKGLFFQKKEDVFVEFD